MINLQKSQIANLIFVLSIILIILMVKNWGCIVLKFTPLPEKLFLLKKRNLVLLYGASICPSCHSGTYINSLKKSSSYTAFVLPAEFRDYEVENFKNVFSIKADIIKGDDEVKRFVDKIRSCRKMDEWSGNFHIRVSDTGKVEKVLKF
jgi:hypothetical protein